MFWALAILFLIIAFICVAAVIGDNEVKSVVRPVAVVGAAFIGAWAFVLMTFTLLVATGRIL